MSDTNSSSRGIPLPPRWFIRTAWKAHKALFRMSGGRVGLSEATDTKEGLALLTTTGRKSGEPRNVMIGYYEDNGSYVTMAMNGWGPAEPAWWLNLRANPTAELRLASGPVEVRGQAAEGAEHERLWERWRELDKSVDRFSARRPDGTAVVVLRPTP